MVLRLYLSNFTFEHTAELGLGQGIRLLACLGTKNSRVAENPELMCPGVGIENVKIIYPQIKIIKIFGSQNYIRYAYT